MTIVMSLISRTIQLFEHPPLYSKHSNTHVWNYYSNIQIPTLCGPRTGVTECLLAFDSLCGAKAKVTKHLLAYYKHFRTSTRLLLSLRSSSGVVKRVLAFDSLCGAWTRVAKCAIAFDSPCRAWMGVAKRVIAFNSPCGSQTGVSKHPSTISVELERGLENVY